MAAYRRVYDSRHLQADCQEPGSAAEPYARYSSMGLLVTICVTVLYMTTPRVTPASIGRMNVVQM